jgi:antitoxin HicB
MKHSARLRDYPFTVRPLAKKEGGGYLIEFPDLPGCISDGETPEDAIRNGQDALQGYLLTLKELGNVEASGSEEPAGAIALRLYT